MKYDPRAHGRTSRDNPATDALRQEWEMVSQLPQGDGEWVPRSAVFVDDSISPRENANVDREKVREYAGVFRQLPPIVVQKDTFVLIDGNHRLNAAFESDASTLHIRVKELDIPDSELREAAFHANSGHGRQLTTKERLAFLKYLILEKKDTRAYLELARACGLNRATVMDYVTKWTGPRNNRSTPEPEKSVSDFRQHKTLPPPAKPSGGAVTRTRDPQAEPEWEEPVRDAEEAYEEPYREVEEEVEHGTTSPVAPSVETGAGETRHSPAPDPWARFKKADSPEEAWLTDFALCMERCPFIGGRDLDEAVAKHPEAKRVRGALEIVRMLAEVPA